MLTAKHRGSHGRLTACTAAAPLPLLAALVAQVWVFLCCWRRHAAADDDTAPFTIATPSGAAGRTADVAPSWTHSGQSYLTRGRIDPRRARSRGASCVLIREFPQVNWLQSTSEADKSVRFRVKFPADLTYQKSLKSVNFWRSYSKTKKMDVFRDKV